MVKRFFTEEQQKRDLPAAATGNDDELSEDEGEDTLTPVRSSNRSTKRRAASVKAEKKIKKERAYIASLRDEANRANSSSREQASTSSGGHISGPKRNRDAFAAVGPGYRLWETANSASYLTAAVASSPPPATGESSPPVRDSPDRRVWGAALKRFGSQLSSQSKKPLSTVTSETVSLGVQPEAQNGSLTETESIKPETINSKSDGKQTNDSEATSTETVSTKAELHQMHLNLISSSDFDASQRFTCTALGLADPRSFDDLLYALKEKLYTDYQDDTLMRSLLHLFNCNRTLSCHPTNTLPLNSCVSLLAQIVANLITEDAAQLAKCSRIRRSKLEPKLVAFSGAMECLSAIGYTTAEALGEPDRDWFIFEAGSDKKAVQDKLTNILQLLQTPQVFPFELDRQIQIDKAPKQSISNSEPDYKPLFTQLHFNFTAQGGEQRIEASFQVNETLQQVKDWFIAGNFTKTSVSDIDLKDDSDSLSDLAANQKTLEELKLSPSASLTVVFK